MSMMASTSDGLNDIQQVPEVIAKFLKSSGKKLQNGSLPWQLYLGVLIASTEKLQKVRWNPGVMMMLLQIQREGIGDYETLFFFMDRYYGLVEPYLDYVVKVSNIKDADYVSKIILHHSLLFYLIHFHFKKTDMNINYYKNMNNLVSLFTESQLMIYRKIKKRSKDEVIIGKIEEDIALNILGALHFLLDGETDIMLEGLLIGRNFCISFYYKIYGNVVRKIGTRVLKDKTSDVHSYILKVFAIKLLVLAYRGIKDSQNEIIEKARKYLIPSPEYLEILKNGIFKCILKTPPDISKLTEFLLREDFCLKSKVNEYFDMIQYKKPVMSSKENNFEMPNSNAKKEEEKKQMEKIPQDNHFSDKENKTIKSKSPLEGTKREIRDSIKCSIPLIDSMKKNDIEDYNKIKKSRIGSIKKNQNYLTMKNYKIPVEASMEKGNENERLKSACCGEVIKSFFFNILESNKYESVKKHCEKFGYYYPRLLWDGLVGIIIENNHKFAYMCCCLKILLKKTYHKLDLDVTLREFFSSLTPLIINNIVDIDDSDNKILEYKCVDLEQLPFGYNEENNVKILSDVNSNIKNDLNFFSQLELNFMENTNIVNEMLVNWGEMSLPSESLNNEFGTLSIFNEISNMSPSFSIENQDTETLSDEIASQLTEEHSNQTFPLREQTNLKPDQCSASLHAFINADADQLHINSNESVLLGHQDSLPLSFSSTALNNNIKPESLLRAPNKEVIEKPDDEPEQMNLLRIENLNTSEICSLFIESKDKVIEKSSDEIIEISDDDEPSFNVNLSTSSNSGFEKSCDDSVIEISDTEQSLNDNLSTPVNFEKNPDKHITNSLLRVPNNELYDNSSGELIIEIPDDETSFTVNSTETNFNMNTSQNEVESFLGKQNDEEVYENCHDNMIILNPDDMPTVDPNISSVVNIDIDPDENEESFLRIPNEEIYEKCLDDMIILNPDDIPTLNVNLSTAVNVNINPDKNEVVSLLVVRNEEVHENSCEDSLLVLNDNVPSLNFTSSTSVNINADNNVTEALLIMPVKEVLEKSYENPMHVVVDDISPVNVNSNINFNINTDKNEVPSLLIVKNEEVYKKSFDDSLILFPDNFSPINANSTRAVSLIKNPNSNEIESMSRVPCQGKHEKCDDSTLAVIENLSFIEGPSVNEGPSVIEGPSLIDDGPSLIDNEPSINKVPSLVDERPSVVNYSTDVCFNINPNNNNEVVSLLPILNGNVNKPYDKSIIVSPDNVLSFNDDSSTAVNLIISPYNHEHPYDVLSSDLNSTTAINYTINSDKSKVESLLRVPSEDMYKECDKTKSFISGDEQCLNDDSSRSISLNIVPDKNEDKSSISEDVHDDSTIGISNDLLSLNVNPSALHNLNINPDKRKTESLLRVPNEEGYDKVNYISSLQIPENEPVNPSSIVNYNVIHDKNKIVSVLRAPNGEVYETSCGDSIISIPGDEPPLTVSSPRAINLTINSDKHNIESLLSIPDEEVSEKSSGISTNISCPIMNETSNAFDDNYFLTPGDSFWLQDSSEKVLDLSIKKRISHDANVLPLSDNPENTFIHGSNEGEHFHDEVFVITSKPLFEISNKIRIKAKPFSSNKEMPSDSTNSSFGVVIHETPTFNEAVATSNTTNGNVEDGVLNEEKQINNLSLFAEKMLDSKKDFVEKSIRQVKKPHPTELDNTQPFKRFKNDTSALPSPTPPDSVSTLDTLITKAPNHLSSEDKAHFPCFRLRLDNDGNATLECHCVLCVLVCSSQNGQNKLSTGKNNTTGSDEDHNVLVRLPIKKRKLNMDAKYNQSSIQNIVSLLANPCSSQANLSYYPTAPMVSIANMDNLLKNVSGLLWFKNAVPQNSGGPENTPSEPSTLTVLNATSYKPDTFSHNDHSSKMPNKSHMNSSNSNISNNISDTNVDSEGPQLSNIKNAHNPFLKSFINPKDIFLDKSSVPSSVFPSGTEQTIFGRSQSVSITGDSSNGFPYAQYAHNNYENRNLVADKPAKSRRPRQINRSSVIQNSVNTPYNVASSPRKRQIRTPRRSNRNTVIQNTLGPPFNAVSSLENHEASTPWSSNRGTVIKNPTHEPYMASQFQLSQASLPTSEIPQPMFTMPYNNGYYFPQYFNFLNR